MTRASSIKENYFLETSDEKHFEKIMNEMNNLEYKKNVAEVSSGLRKRGSILKAPGTSSGNEKIEKKKVHWPENLPRYTIEKRWRNLKKVKKIQRTIRTPGLSARPSGDHGFLVVMNHIKLYGF